MIKAVLLVILVMAVGACSTVRSNIKPLQVVPYVEIERYLGTWYNIARYPNWFQKDCFDSRADYRLRQDGDLKVLNTCYKGGPEGPLDAARGKAWVVDRQSNAKLKVSFFWPFSGNYWIIDLDEDYRYVVVGEPNRKYLWIMARRPFLDINTYNAILARLVEQGYDPEKLVRD
jgi:apolipoprotein D and lipocalin family protein